MSFIYILVGLAVGLIACYALFACKKEKKPGTTPWRECTYCTRCKQVYDNSSIFSTPVYTCPDCGKSTDYRAYRYYKGKMEVQGK